MINQRIWRIAGINFEHFHIGDNLRFAANHPQVKVVGVCDEHRSRMQPAIDDLGLTSDQVFTNWEQCLEKTKPDLVIACPAAASHGLWAERLLSRQVDVMMEKPMAASLGEADRMLAATNQSGRMLAINWPMIWYPAHQTALRLIQEQHIGDVLELHYYDGNRGPLWHTAGKVETIAEEVAREKPNSWFYKKEFGGGSLLDYLGYGTTLGTWFNGGQLPIEVTAVVDQPAGLEVDEHAIVIARYASGLSKFETRWGTFTDPWTYQPQPKCGFVFVDSDGTLSCFDGESTVRMQTRSEPHGIVLPVDPPSSRFTDPVSYMLDCLSQDLPITGPMSLEISYIGQRIVDSAMLSVAERRTVPLL